jgi:FkbM family methyltransferase
MLFSGHLREEMKNHRLQAADVGAQGGIVEHWLPFLEYLEVDAFEPDPTDYLKQKSKAPANIHWHPYALARESGERDLYVLNRSSGSSLYPPNNDVLGAFTVDSYCRLKEVKKVNCFSYPDFMRSSGRPAPHLIKLDVQGAELEILESLFVASKKNILAVETEVEFLEVYKGQPLFADVDNFMKSQDFELLDLRTHRAYRARENQECFYLRKFNTAGGGPTAISAQLVAGDALYFRKYDSPLVLASKHTLLHYILVTVIYRFYEWSLLAIESGVREGVLTSAEAGELTKAVKKLIPSPWFFQRRNAAGVWSRRALRHIFKIDGSYQTFWTRRVWPDQ